MAHTCATVRRAESAQPCNTSFHPRRTCPSPKPIKAPTDEQIEEDIEPVAPPSVAMPRKACPTPIQSIDAPTVAYEEMLRRPGR